MAVRDRSLAGPVTALRASTIIGIPGPPGAPGAGGTIPPGTGVVVQAGSSTSIVSDGLANQLFGMSSGAVKQFFTLTGDASLTGGALTLASTAVTPGTYGDASHVGAFTVDAKGRITAASNISISGLPSGTGLVRVDTGTGSVIADGTADQLFGRNHANTADVFFTLGGDATIASGNLTLAAIAGIAGTYGDATHSAQITFDSKGRATSGVNVPITGTPPGGSAGGDLTGTYPNPTVAKIQSNTITAGALTKGQFLTATSTTNWAATSLSGDTSASSSTAGLLTVVGLQSYALSASAPGDLQILQMEAGFDPTTVGTVKAWYKNGTLITQSGGSATAWGDSGPSGDANRNTTASGTNPGYTASNGLLNGKPSIDFTASGMSLVSGTWSSARTQPCTIFVVGYGSGSYFLDGLSAQQAIYNPSNTRLFDGAFVTSGVSSTSPSVIGAVFGGAGANASAIYVNTTTPVLGTLVGTTATGITIGNTAGGGPFYLNGSIGEILVFDGTLSAGNIAKVMGYLGQKFGITVTGGVAPVSTWTPVSITGDITATTPYGTLDVVSLTGASNAVAMLANSLIWSKGLTGPSISQAAQTTDVATFAMTIAAQAAWPSASTNLVGADVILSGGAGATTNGTPGGVNIKLLAHSGTGINSFFKVTQSNNTLVWLGGYNNASAAGTIWLGNGITPNNSNFALYGDGSFETRINAATQINFWINGAAVASLSGTALTWNTNIGNPSIAQTTPTTDVTATGMFITAQSAWSGATTHLSGGDLTIGAGTAKDGTLGAALNFKGGTNGSGAGVPGVINITAASLLFVPAVTGCQIGQLAPVSDVAPLALSIEAANAWASASTNTTGGTLNLISGNPSSNSTSAFISLLGGTNSASVPAAVGAIHVRTSAIGGNPSDSSNSPVPWPWASSTFSIASSGTITLANSQAASPVLVLTGTITAPTTIVFPNSPGFWLVDLSGVAGYSATNSIGFKSGSTTKLVVNSATALSGTDTLVVVVTNGSNTIYVLGSTATAI